MRNKTSNRTPQYLNKNKQENKHHTHKKYQKINKTKRRKKKERERMQGFISPQP
jgi:hypothetical protein